MKVCSLSVSVSSLSPALLTLCSSRCPSEPFFLITVPLALYCNHTGLLEFKGSETLTLCSYIASASVGQLEVAYCFGSHRFRSSLVLLNYSLLKISVSFLFHFITRTFQLPLRNVIASYCCLIVCHLIQNGFPAIWISFMKAEILVIFKAASSQTLNNNLVKGTKNKCLHQNTYVI